MDVPAPALSTKYSLFRSLFPSANNRTKRSCICEIIINDVSLLHTVHLLSPATAMSEAAAEG